MYNILTLNKIAAIGTSRLGDNYKYGDDVQNPDAVLVRSAAMHDMEFADNFLQLQEQAQAQTTFRRISAVSRYCCFQYTGC